MAIDKKKTVAMLAEIAELAEHATLTGINGSTTPRAISRYNALLESLLAEDLVPKELFSPIPANGSMGDLLVDSKLLVSYLREKKEHRVEVCCESVVEGVDDAQCCADKHLILRLAPFASSEDLRVLIESYLAQGEPVDAGFVESMAPFIEQSDLSALIKQMASRTFKRPKGVPVPPEPPMPPMPPLEPLQQTKEIHVTVHQEVVEDDENEGEPVPLAHPDIPAEVRLQALSDRMKAEDISDEEFEELAQEMLRLKRSMKS